MYLQKIRGGLFGLAIGDALGATLEFMSRKEVQATYGVHQEITGGGWLGLTAGTWTDDTEMTLLVAEGILAAPEAPVEEIGKRFVSWYDSKPKDIGQTNKLAIGNYKETGNWEQASLQASRILGGRVAGNGSLMRTLPVSFAYLNRFQQMDMFARKISRMTHDDFQAETACIFYNRFVAALLRAKDLKRTYDELFQSLLDREDPDLIKQHQHFFERLGNFHDLKIDALKPTGYVLDTLEAALWCFLHSSTFEEAIVKAVNLGGDADTIGAVTGGMAGTFYGHQAIPIKWVKQLQNQQRLEQAAGGLYVLAWRATHGR